MIERLKSIKTSYVDHEVEMQIEKELNNYLVSINKPFLFDYLNYIVREMIGNANKANMKRVHFNIKELEISSSSDYEKGINTFKEEMLGNYHLYKTSAKNYGYYVRLDKFITKGYLVILVSNNTSMLEVEKSRFFKKLNDTARFTTFEEAVEKGLDLQEGGGFGIILSLMMLRKLGLNENYFKLITNNDSTQVRIIIPLTLLNKEESEGIATAVVNEIDEIPQFPQHIQELQKIINNPNSNFSHIAYIIKKDPSLIADLLKTANSAFYMLPKKVRTIEEAVRIIGIKGIRNLVVTYTAKGIMMNKYNINMIKNIMAHSYEVAYYAYEMAKLLKLNDIIDDVYLAGILHDFGKIIINALKPGMIEKIQKYCNTNEIKINLIESLTSGYNHSLIGSKLAEKWNFPHSLVETIMYHHIPLDSSDEYSKLVYIIYLADIMYYFNRNEIGFNYINNNVLKYFNIDNKDTFSKISKSIYSNFTIRKKQLEIA